MNPATFVAMGIQMVGSAMAANAQADQANYESQVASENARRAALQAEHIRFAGLQAEEAKRREIRKSLGRSAAAIEQSHIGGAAYGSAGELVKDAATQGEFDAMSVRYGAQTDAYAQDLESLNQKDAAQAAKRRARGAKTSGYINMATAVASGAANYSGMRRQMKAYGGGNRVTAWRMPSVQSALARY